LRLGRSVIEARNRAATGCADFLNSAMATYAWASFCWGLKPAPPRIQPCRALSGQLRLFRPHTWLATLSAAHAWFRCMVPNPTRRERTQSDRRHRRLLSWQPAIRRPAFVGRVGGGLGCLGRVVGAASRWAGGIKPLRAGAPSGRKVAYLRPAQAYELISAPRPTSMIFGVFQDIAVSPNEFVVGGPDGWLGLAEESASRRAGIAVRRSPNSCPDKTALVPRARALNTSGFVS
jgi:hypothetical protein